MPTQIDTVFYKEFLAERQEILCHKWIESEKAGYDIAFERQVLIDSIIAVCGEMNERPADEAQRMIFAGSRLALALLKGGAARNQPAYRVKGGVSM
jgi:hypothetical protein